MRGWNPTQLHGECFINHEIRIPLKQPGLEWKIRPFFFFVAQVVLNKVDQLDNNVDFARAFGTLGALFGGRTGGWCGYSGSERNLEYFNKGLIRASKGCWNVDGTSIITCNSYCWLLVRTYDIGMMSLYNYLFYRYKHDFMISDIILHDALQFGYTGFKFEGWHLGTYTIWTWNTRPFLQRKRAWFTAGNWGKLSNK